MIYDLENYDHRLSLRLAQSALHAYDTPAQIRARGAIPIYSPHLDLQAVIEKSDDATILSFRGTASLQNWKVDINAIPNHKGIHTGFYDAYNILKDQIFDTLPHRPSNNGFISEVDHSCPLFICGHSLGGALALLAVDDYRPDACYTYGKPRVFDHYYVRQNAEYINQINLFRIVDHEDLVPHVPGLIGGYTHVGTLALISSLGDFEINPSAWRQARGHIKGISGDLFRIFSGHLPDWVIVKEHSMLRYLRALEQVRLPTKTS